MSDPSVLGDSISNDYDGHLKRTWEVGKASGRILTVVMGSGVLSLGWAIAQLGWVAGPIVMFLFFSVSYYTWSLVTDVCHRPGDPETGSRNYTYLVLIRFNPNWMQGKVCAWILNVNLVALAVGCATTASNIMVATKKSICFHTSYGYTDQSRGLCSTPSYIMNIVYGIIQIIISQLPRHAFEQILFCAISGGMFATYWGVTNRKFKGSLTGIGSVTGMTKLWGVLQGIGVISFACSYYTTILTETLRSEPSKMKKATLISVMVVSAIVYMLCGFMSYAAFGDLTPEDLLLLLSTSAGRSGSYWLLVDIANAARIINNMCAYQAYCQPVYALGEKLISERFPSVAANHGLIIRLVWRSVFVLVTIIVSIFVPFVKDVVGLIGALGFSCLAVYFPVEMYISQKKTVKWTREWVFLRVLWVTTLVLSLAVAAAILHHLKT